jgi:DNA-binding transcriptional MerR regulator
MAAHPLTVPNRLSLAVVAKRTGLHPDLVRRLVALSLLDARRDEQARLWFAPEAVTVLARIQRLRAGVGLNYAAVGVVLDLLDRIAVLEAALRARSETPWISTG